MWISKETSLVLSSITFFFWHLSNMLIMWRGGLFHGLCSVFSHRKKQPTRKATHNEECAQYWACCSSGSNLPHVLLTSECAAVFVCVAQTKANKQEIQPLPLMTSQTPENSAAWEEEGQGWCSICLAWDCGRGYVFLHSWSKSQSSHVCWHVKVPPLLKKSF